jgi:two-component system, chemotaxis family, protein-glutamate methylesterase/glutaminase
MSRKISVLVVDDSALMRKLIPQMLERDPDIHVVGTAMDGGFALDKIAQLKPDVVTVDLEMPRVKGLDFLRHIMRTSPLPVVIVSAYSTHGASATFKALALGAFDFVAKPQIGGALGIDAVTAELIAKVKAAAATRPGAAHPVPAFTDSCGPVARSAATRQAVGVVAIGASTGGPNALQYLLSQLPEEFPAAIVVTQHMPAGFTATFARRLSECTRLEVKEAEAGDTLTAGRVLIAPGNRHMKVRRLPLGGVILLGDEAPVSGHRPSVDVLFRSVAESFGASCLAALMTGMGEDGAEGLGAVKAAGGTTIAQDEESSVVFGMPRAAITRGYAQRVLSLERIAPAILAHWSNQNSVPQRGTATAV